MLHTAELLQHLALGPKALQGAAGRQELQLEAGFVQDRADEVGLQAVWAQGRDASGAGSSSVAVASPEEAASGAHHPEGERLRAGQRWLVPRAVQQLRHASPSLLGGKGGSSSRREDIRASVRVQQAKQLHASNAICCCCSWRRLLQAAAACLCQGAQAVHPRVCQRLNLCRLLLQGC